MKILINIFIVIISTSAQILPQFFAEKEISPYVIEFMRIADETSQFYVPSMGLQKEFSNDEIIRIAEIFYRAIQDDPVGYNENLFMENRNWEEKVLAEGIEKHNLKPAMKLKILQDEIGKKYGENFAEIISVPAFIRGTVISKNISQYQTFDKRIKSKQTNIIVVIEDVIKGNKFFSIGDTITISYLGAWFRDSKNILFQVGKTYLFLLAPWWDGHREYNGEITIDFLPDNNFGIYPIENDSVITERNYFGAGNTSSWLKFKEHFINYYIINKGGE